MIITLRQYVLICICVVFVIMIYILAGMYLAKNKQVAQPPESSIQITAEDVSSTELIDNPFEFLSAEPAMDEAGRLEMIERLNRAP